MEENDDLLIIEPMFSCFGIMTWCTVLLLCDLILFQNCKTGLPKPVPGTLQHSLHLLSHWIFEHNQQPFFSLHNASPYHDANTRLLKCWNQTVVFVFLICSPCNVDATTRVIQMDITHLTKPLVTLSHLIPQFCFA
ncbi:hypothetical protein BT96DRAFT_1094746, partial [Gymnopus androsaceus JB14]